MHNSIESLSPEDKAFASKWSFTALILGPIYFFSNGLIVPGFLMFVPFYNIYLGIKAFFSGRKMSWEKGEWVSFESYKKRQLLLRKVAIGFSILFVAFFAFISVILFTGLKDPTVAANTFADDLVAGNTDKIYAEDVTADISGSVTKDDFETNFGKFKGGTYSFSSVKRDNDETSVSGTITAPSTNAVYDISILADKVGDGWKVSSVTIEPEK